MPNPLDALKKASSIGPSMFDDTSNVKQSMMPFLPGGSGVLEGLKGLFTKKAPQMVGEALPTLGEVSAEHAPLGGEALYNAARPAAEKIKDPVLAALDRIMARNGG